MVTHIVFFKLTNPTSEGIKAVRDKLLSMDGKISQLRHLEVGVDVIRSERSHDVALVTRFDSLDDLPGLRSKSLPENPVTPLSQETRAALT
jgi:hypothetical protein